MEEWKEYKLGDICTKIGSGATPKGGKEAYLGGNISLIRSQNVLDFTFSEDGLAYINDEQANKLKNVEVKENDVLLNITGDSVARACIVPNAILPARVNQHVAIIRGDNSVVLNEFILYALQYKKQYLLSISQGGGTRNALTKKMIEDFIINLPSLPTQQKIANILSSLDDKIEVNRRINEQLEELAGELFKSWFVDFEPFKDGEFVDSELGMIPKGWKVGTISEICNILSGFAFKSTSFVDEGKYRLITIKGVQDGHLETNGSVCINELPIKMPSYCLLNIGDVLLSLTGNVGRCCFVDREELLLNQRVAKLQPINNDDISFVYTLFRKQEFKIKLEMMARGTAQANLSPIETSKVNIIIPNREVLDEFGSTVNKFFWKMINAQQEITHLTTLRDTLLSKLMSGEIDVNEIEI